MYARTFIGVLLAAVTTAHAERVVLLADPGQGAELHSALQVALVGVEITDMAPPQGPLRLDRAASAQRVAVSVGADAAVWIDGEANDVCAVSADGRSFRHAPLPQDPRARVFAAIAT